MVRGSTPTFTFTIPFDISLIDKLYVTVEQTIEDNIIQVEKSKEQCTLEGNQITCKLTQEDTLRFKQYHHILIQLRVLTSGGDSLVSKAFKLPVSKLLKEGVI